ncbi:hypothetical protein PR202_ga08224 [Eleusine coracana subsp. coracana]|uniref:Uncharacterized protein n=1 Tax=Eleusine coracana subsp. coracana TaxID=191504 RepID=A0AAV5C2N8_ELECO|nr:hypothetical protein PR202_ga08224 [Eleusine coracana subsp. coracana]
MVGRAHQVRRVEVDLGQNLEQLGDLGRRRRGEAGAVAPAQRDSLARPIWCSPGPVADPSSSTDASQPCTKQSWKWSRTASATN